MSSNTLIDEAPAAGPKKPEPVILRSIHDYSLTTTALESRKEELKKLAKKNTDEGYTREARAVQADADAIEHHILPSFRAQRELPLVSIDQLEKEVAGALNRFVTTAFAGLGDPKVLVTPEGIGSRKKVLLQQLATRVTLYATQLADEAFNQGVAARAQTSEALALGAIATLRAQGD
jgi:SepF-like predicted cell division protein (DUF552 family)